MELIKKVSKIHTFFFKKIKKEGVSSIYIFGIRVFSYKGRKQREQYVFYKAYEKKMEQFIGMGVDNNSNRDPKIIISLTSYPARIKNIHSCLYSLLTQSLKPDLIILWLSQANFPGKEKDLPERVLRLRENGLTIKWCEDIKSYKKLIPTLKEFPSEIIVTTDDDVIYSELMLEKLYLNYLQAPQNIQAHWLTKFEFEGARWKATSRDSYEGESYLNMLTGVGGVLYPPNCLHKDVLNEKLFMRLAPSNDDQWFWCQALRNNIKTRLVEDNEQDVIYTQDSQDVALWHINKGEPNLFWKDFQRLTAYYPELESKMFLELQEKN